MKIREFAIVPKELKDTTSCGTTYSGQPVGSAQDIVPQNLVPENELALEVDSPIEEHPDHSAITEGVSQIFRRKKGGAPKMGFRCTSGPRKGRIVAKPSTCFAKLDPVKGAKIRKKRQIKAKQAGVRMGIRKRSGAGSLRLKGAQIKKKKGSAPAMGAQKPLKSRIVKPKKK
jgi:hypothetical protein